jgi:hypothetical protein
MDEQVKELLELAGKIDAAAGKKFHSGRGLSPDACVIAASNLIAAAAKTPKK